MKFICDDMLGKLAKFLRALGYDTFYDREIKDHQLLRRAAEEDRIVVTKDRKLIQVRTIPKYVLIWGNQPLEQLDELKQKAGLVIDKGSIFSRCLECNTPLTPIEKDRVKDKVWPYIYQTQDRFWQCTRCDKIYWAGTHIQRMQEKLKKSGIIVENR